jgi:hypothetical protein
LYKVQLTKNLKNRLTHPAGGRDGNSVFLT